MRAEADGILLSHLHRNVVLDETLGEDGSLEQEGAGRLKPLQRAHERIANVSRDAQCEIGRDRIDERDLRIGNDEHVLGVHGTPPPD